MHLRQVQNKACTVFLTTVLSLMLACTPFASQAFASVSKADIVYGQSVDARGLSVAQCPDIDANFAYVMDSDGVVYFQRNSTDSTAIASLTKIMTAIVALDAVQEGIASNDTIVKVSARAAEVGESSAGLQQGDTIPLSTALKALLIPSGNDAAIAIAEAVGPLLLDRALSQGDSLQMPDGSGVSENDEDAGYNAFVAGMNAKAKELGCENTVFENPHGLDYDEWTGDEHSCAIDVARMAEHAMKNDEFRSIVGGGDDTISVNRGNGSVQVSLATTDELIGKYDGALGIKTGFTNLAGESFAAAAQKNGRELYAVVIDSSSESQRFDDAKTLFDWVGNHMKTYQLANSPETTTMSINGSSNEVPVLAEVPLEDYMDKTIKATLGNDPQATLDIFDLNGNVSQSLDFNKLSGSIKPGDKVGTITFKQHNETIATKDLVACEKADPPGLFEGVGIWWQRLWCGLTGQPQVASPLTLNQTPLINDKTSALS